MMVGEIRDKETAEIAIQAALTGHLVFSTLHTNDAPGALSRLGDLGMEPFLLASSLTGVLAQRLVRRICKLCKESYEATDEELQRMCPDEVSPTPVTLHRGRGCRACRKSGYSGRLGIFEVLAVNDSTATRRTADLARSPSGAGPRVTGAPAAGTARCRGT